jgi:hypothetical protein
MIKQQFNDVPLFMGLCFSPRVLIIDRIRWNDCEHSKSAYIENRANQNE